MATNENGLIFYKLKSDYKGDTTKNCGLLGDEIDGNFHFLRGMDIKEIGFDPETNSLFLIRLNNEKIEFPEAAGKLANYEFAYDKETGKLTITYPDGENVVVEGFTKARDMAVSSTDKLIGAGTLDSPLDISSSYLTGTYRPAEKLIDLTDPEGEKLPASPSEGERFVTKESINPGGLFYTYDEVVKINDTLEEHSSEWRVPTIEVWNEMLNAQECEEDKHHGDEGTCFEWTGKRAGKLVKSAINQSTNIDFWEKWEDEDKTEGTRNETGLSIIPLGEKPEFSNELIGLGQTAYLWSISSETEIDERDIMAKRFDFNHNNVMQISINPQKRMPVRLFKRYTGKNNISYENIEGVPTSTVLLKNCGMVWTKENVSLPQFITKGEERVTEELYKKIKEAFPTLVERTKYFVNQWENGMWHKIPMEEGESIVLFHAPNANMHEWRIIGEELVDTADAIKEEFSNELLKINAKIQEEADARYQADLAEAAERAKKIQEEADARYQADLAEADERAKKIQEEADARYQADIAESNARISAIATEAEARASQDEYLAGVIKTQDDYLSGLITAERNERIEAINNIDGEAAQTLEKINQEISDRQQADSDLGGRVDQEVSDRKQADSGLQEQITANKLSNADKDQSISLVETASGTTIKVNLPKDGVIKFDKDGLYFNGFFGNF